MTTSPEPTLAIDVTATGVAFWVHVSPRARRPEVGGVHDASLRVAVKEPPIQGKANAACSKAVARALGLRPTDVEIDPASKGRRKRVRISGDPQTLRGRLLTLASGGALG